MLVEKIKKEGNLVINFFSISMQIFALLCKPNIMENTKKWSQSRIIRRESNFAPLLYDNCVIINVDCRMEGGKSELYHSMGGWNVLLIKHANPIKRCKIS